MVHPGQFVHLAKTPYLMNFVKSEPEATTALILEERRIKIHRVVVFDTLPNQVISSPGCPKVSFSFSRTREKITKMDIPGIFSGICKFGLKLDQR